MSSIFYGKQQFSYEGGVLGFCAEFPSLSWLSGTSGFLRPRTLPVKTVSGGALHAGGVFWNDNSLDYMALRQWIAEGALKN